MTKRIRLNRKQLRLLDDALITKYKAVRKEIERQLESGVPKDHLYSELDKLKYIADLHEDIVYLRHSYECELGLRSNVPSVRRLDEAHPVRTEVSRKTN